VVVDGHGRQSISRLNGCPSSGLDFAISPRKHMPRPIMATVSVPAMQHNLQNVASRLRTQALRLHRPAPRIWAVIKANAYGHGLANGLAGFSEADGLAMLDLDEAVACREAGWQG